MSKPNDFEQKKKEGVPESLTPSTSGPTVVGIGASAGGLAALKTFFELVPEDSGLAFVVVMHLSPEHESHLADLLQRHVRMPVIQVTETLALEENQVYVIPPNANLNTIDTHLRLSPLEESRSARAPVDHFFRTLSKTHDGRAIGVILTGTGSDGTLGLREIKAQGGLAIVQDPNEAEYDGMPQSAISNAAADIILPLAEIPDTILNFVRTQPRIAETTLADAEADDRQMMHRIFALLRTRTGRDFSRYKPATILRRITRRMQFHKLEILAQYLDVLRDQHEETRALADDLLINVTSFFRDPEVFQLLESRIIPQLFTAKQAKDNLRVWSVGCATGEEAYSLAMLLIEHASRHNQPPLIQVFASELHGSSLDKAREGFYPGDIETDVSPERLQRFFHKENGGYRIRKEVRELVIFAPHNILSDPPFSHVDLISCRNLLIYLQREVQQEVLEVFHYALNPDGYLLLGASETADAAELFRVEDKKRCLYRKLNMPRPELRLPVFPLTKAKLTSDTTRSEIMSEPVSYGSLHQRMVEQVAPPSILVSADDKVVHLSTNVGRFLIHPGGEMTTNLYKLVRDELRIELRTALHQCRESGQPVRTQPIPVRFNGHTNLVSLQVRISTDAQQAGFALVIFEEWAESESGALKTTHDVYIHPVDDGESEHARQRMQAIIEEYETSQEELKSSIEEMQSTNEELRSTMEELETSKEELQSMNEELQTVNQENRHKVEELAQLSGDLHNLLAATDIATLFLDRQFCILRFTPKVSELFNVRMTDRGRPLSNFTHRLGYNKLVEDAKQVLAQLTNIEREVQDENGRWYMCRLRPYRSNEDRIEGVVITFIDITTRKQAEDLVRASEERQTFLLQLSDVLRPLADPAAIEVEATRLLGEFLGADRVVYAEFEPDENRYVINHDYTAADMASMTGGQQLSNFGAYWLEGYRAGRTLTSSDFTKISGAHAAAFEAIGVRACVGVPVHKKGKLVAALFVHSATPRDWSPLDVTLIEATTDRTWAAVERAKAESALRLSEIKYRSLFDSIDEGFCIIEVVFEGELPVDYVFLEVNPAFERHTGLVNAAGRSMRTMVPEHDAFWYQVYGRVAKTGEPQRFEQRAAALGREYDVYAFRLGPPQQPKVAILFNDITKRKRSEERQAFLLNLSDVLRPLDDANEIKKQAMQVLGQQLGVLRAQYWEPDATGEYVESAGGYTDGSVQPMTARVRLEDFGSFVKQAFYQGQTTTVIDVTTDPRVTKAALAAYEAWGIRAWAAVPLVKHGRFVASLGLHHGTPHHWTADELSLVEDVAQRTWEAVERAKAETARHETQLELHELNTALDERVQSQTRELLARENQLQGLALELTNTEQKERRRIALLLHDDVQQLVVAAKMRAGTLQAGPLATEQKGQLQSISELLEQTLAVTRSLIADLVPLNLHEQGLGAALAELGSKMKQQHDLLVRVQAAENAEPANNSLRELLFDGARELLLNVVKHAQTDAAWVDLERNDGQITLTVRDLGKGRTSANVKHVGFGLFHLRERLKLVQGQLHVTSEAGEGTRVTISVKAPLS